MPYFQFMWTDEIVEHLAEHDVTPADFERVVCWATERGFSASSGLPVAWGRTQDGRLIIAVYEHVDRLIVLPVTAYEVSERR